PCPRPPGVGEGGHGRAGRHRRGSSRRQPRAPGARRRAGAAAGRRAMSLDDRVAQFVRELAAAAEVVATGEAEVAVPAPADPELAELADAFNELGAGEGVAGAAATQDEAVQWPGDVAELAAAEPDADTVVAIPLRRGNHAIGVLALYGRGPDEAFSRDDVRLLQSLVRQAETA